LKRDVLTPIDAYVRPSRPTGSGSMTTLRARQRFAIDPRPGGALLRESASVAPEHDGPPGVAVGPRCPGQLSRSSVARSPRTESSPRRPLVHFVRCRPTRGPNGA